jgi:hypothetical protein
LPTPLQDQEVRAAWTWSAVTHAESVTREQDLALIQSKLAEDDVNRFFDLASRHVPAASLSAATGGDLS